ncbi:MAG: excinuclease ABC subunit UvrC [Candidatus Sumerlaeia bacterium]
MDQENHNPPQPQPPPLGDEHRRLLGVTPDEIGSLPELPGVYIMRDARDVVLYVGKAANLRNRVRNYFTGRGDGRITVQFLIRHVDRIETIITANEKEAFLLENTLIKKYLPRYNIQLRDDKTYVSVRVDLGHEWPRAVVVRRRGEQRPQAGSLYLGPYASASDVRETLRWLQRVFPIRSCPDHVLRNRTRPCLLYQIGRCCAPCTKPVDKDAYRRMVEGTVLVLKGRSKDAVRLLEEQMNKHSAGMQFEQAAVLRDRIRAIETTAERQVVQRHDGSDWDIVTIEQAGGYGAFVVFVYRNGLLISSRPFIVRDHDREPADLMEEFIARYYEAETPPGDIYIEPMPAEPAGLEEWLGERREAKVSLREPQRGERRHQMDTARENARQLLEQQLSGKKTVEEIHTQVMEKLSLAAPPDPIECYDISTIQGFATVGSMVTFQDGEPDKSRYRRFRIKSFAGQDDFGALREVLTRRFRRVAAGEQEPPGLVVIDGGKGQLAVAVDVFKTLGIEGVPVVGMAKSRIKHRGDEVWRTEERFFLPGRMNPVVFRENSPALYMLQRLRDEAHRFGITYHRELRGRRNLRSVLEDIPGVGKTRASTLLRHFGSLRKIKDATADEIANVRGIPRDLAERIVARLASQPVLAPPPEKNHEAPLIDDEIIEAPDSTEPPAPDDWQPDLG